MSDDSQIVIPPSFVALYCVSGHGRPSLSRTDLTARYELCETLANILVERAQTLQWSLGATEDDVLQRIGAGLREEGSAVTLPETEWILRRLAELLDGEKPVQSGARR